MCDWLAVSSFFRWNYVPAQALEEAHTHILASGGYFKKLRPSQDSQDVRRARHWAGSFTRWVKAFLSYLPFFSQTVERVGEVYAKRKFIFEWSMTDYCDRWGISDAVYLTPTIPEDHSLYALPKSVISSLFCPMGRFSVFKSNSTLTSYKLYL